MGNTDTTSEFLLTLLEANSMVANQNFTKEQAAVVDGSAIVAYCAEWVPVLRQAAGN
jgi:hypothetical protein